jgi:SAM-dependent methyltransferase
MESTLQPVDAPLVDALALDAPLRIADVACGGGGTTLAIHRRAPAGSVVHGFDLSPALVEAARARASSVVFDIANIAEDAPAQPYDRLASRFGVMFFPDPPRAFANLTRWLAPGGRFAFAVWGALDDNPWMTTVRDTVAEVVDVPPVESDAPGPFRYGDVAVLVALLEHAGFVDVHARDWTGALPMGGHRSAADAAAAAISSLSTFAELLSDDAALQAARTSLTARFVAHERDGAVWMDAGVHIVTGSRA